MGIEHFKDGRFRVTVQDFSGGLNTGVVGSAIADNEFATFKNFLVDRPGPARKRGAIQSIFADSATGLAYHPGVLKSGLTNKPYYGYSSSQIVAWDESATPVVLHGSLAAGGAVSTPTFINDTLVIPTGTVATYGYSQTGCAGVMFAGGSKHTEHTGGTATFAASATVARNSGTAWDQTIVGSYIINTTDNDATLFAYRIASVTNDSELVLERTYNGSGVGGADAFTIRAAEYARVTPGIFAPASLWTPAGNLLGARYTVAWQGRLFAADTIEADAKHYPCRLRWSDLDGGTSNGTSPFHGLHAWSATAFVDLPDLQRIRGIYVHGDALVVVGQSGIAIIRGTATFSTRGSMEVTNTWTGYEVNANAESSDYVDTCVSTPYGFYFWDAGRGLCVWRGGSQPEVVSTWREKSAITGSMTPATIGYYQDHLFMFQRESAVSGWVFHIKSGAWFEIPAATNNTRIAHLQQGRGADSNDGEFLVGMNATTDNIVNLSNVLDSPGDAATDAGGGAITAELTTKNFGIPGYRYQPDKIILIYKLTDLTTTNPYYAVTVSTGLPGATNDTASSSTEFIETTTPEQKIWDNPGVIADALVRAKVVQTNNCGVGEIHAIIIEGTYEGEYPST